MSRIILVALGLALTVAGCDRFPDLSIQVVANLAPDDTTCSVSEDQEETVARGRLDLAYLTRYGYIMTPQIASYLVDNSLEIQGRSQNFQVTSFDVTIKLPDATTPELSGGLPNPYNVRASSPAIEPSAEPGDESLGFAFVEAVPLSYRNALIDLANSTQFDSIVLEVRANGETAGGFSQQSPPFQWPVELCLGCLAARCEPPAMVGDGIGCYPGQDFWQYCAEIVEPEP
jgi:hypothetical protein